MNWYYESGGQQQGPVTETDLDRLLAEGKISPDTLVWREGMSGWTPLRLARPTAAPASAPAAAPIPPVATGLRLESSAPQAGAVPSATAGSDSPQPGWIRCSFTGRYFPPSEIIYLEGKPYSAAAKPQVVASMQSGAVLPTFDTGREGPAWEQRQALGFMQAIIQTCKAVILSPKTTFATMKREGGIQTPFLFNLILGSAVGIVTQILTSIAQMVAIGSATSGSAGGGSATPVAAMVGAGIGGMIFGVIFTPIQVAAAAFIGPGITHGCLMLLKSAPRPFETTFRALNYLYGGLAPVQLVFGIVVALVTLVSMSSPVVGGTAMLGIIGIALPFVIWYFYLAMVAISETQEISRGKAAAALLLPVVVCCGLVLIIALLIGGIAAMSKR
jgi:hypothetical protein